VSEELTEEQKKAVRERCDDRRPDLRNSVLSQEELDALLAAYQSVNAQSGGASDGKPDREVRLYDFSRPDKFSKDHMRIMSAIHTEFAAGLTTMLSSLLQSPTTVELIRADQIPYKEYRASLPSRTMLAKISAEPLSSEMVIEVNPSIVGMWIDCLCGGSPSTSTGPSELSPIDLAVARRTVESCLQVYDECWSNVVKLHPEVRTVTASESHDETILPTETVLACSLEVHMGDFAGTMTICLPITGVEAVMPALSAARSAGTTNNRHEQESADGLRKALAPVSLACRAVLGRAALTFSDTVNLEVGDVIKTNRKADSEIEFWAGNSHVFNCRPGIRNNKLAVVISGPAEAEVAAVEEAVVQLPEELPEQLPEAMLDKAA